jgi:ATP-dependent Zn protease
MAVQYEGASLSPETKSIVEEEVRLLVDGAYNRAKALLIANEDKLHKLAAALVQEETMSGDQISKLLGLPLTQQLSKPSLTAAKRSLAMAKT